MARSAGLLAPSASVPALRSSPPRKTKGSRQRGRELGGGAHRPPVCPSAARSRRRPGKEGTGRRGPEAGAGGGARGRGRARKFPADLPSWATPPPLSTPRLALRCRTSALSTLAPRAALTRSQPAGISGEGRSRAPVPPPKPLASGLRVWESLRGGAREGPAQRAFPRLPSPLQEMGPGWPRRGRGQVALSAGYAPLSAPPTRARRMSRYHQPSRASFTVEA